MIVGASGCEWTMTEQQVNSVAIIDSQSVKSGGVLLGEVSPSKPPSAMVSEAVGFDAGKLIKGRFRFLTVDTLGLVLRVLVTAASVGEREGGKRVLKRVKRMGKDVSRLHTIWVDGGYDGNPFMHARHGCVPLDQSRLSCGLRGCLRSINYYANRLTMIRTIAAWMNASEVAGRAS